MRTVIARYKWPNAWIQAALIFVVAMLPPYLTFGSGGHFISRILMSPNRPYLIYTLILSWFFGVLTLALFVLLIWQLFFDKANAVWLEHGQLIFGNKFLFSVPCSKIEGISLQDQTSIFGTRRAISIRLRNGTRKSIPTGSFRESPEAITSRLNEMLSSP